MNKISSLKPLICIIATNLYYIAVYLKKSAY